MEDAFRDVRPARHEAAALLSLHKLITKVHAVQDINEVLNAIAEGVVEPSPSWPAELSPQQLTVAPVSRAQVWSTPALMPMAPATGQPPAAASTATGVAAIPPAVPSPS